MFVGGEFFDDSRWVLEPTTPLVENAIFLNGGQACLRVICETLKKENLDRILLPAYLCPTILNVLDHQGFTYDFYQVREDFSIELEDLVQQATKYPILYLINYFGFRHSTETLTVFKTLQNSGKLIIEDNAQAGIFIEPLGDFVFNSMRKFTAHDGGYLFYQKRFSPRLPLNDKKTSQRLPLIREYRSKLREYLFENKWDHTTLEGLFYQAEDCYVNDQIILGDATEKRKIENQNWHEIKAIRRSNYCYLLKSLSRVSQLIPIFPALQDNIMPLGLPVYCPGFPRDTLLGMLADESISLTVHWEDLLAHPRTRDNPSTRIMASEIMTLPVDQYTSQVQMDYLVKKLMKYIV